MIIGINHHADVILVFSAPRIYIDFLLKPKNRALLFKFCLE